MTTHGRSGMTSLFVAALVASVVAIGSSVPAAAQGAGGRCHQRCVDVFTDCTEQVGHGSVAACQREFAACQKTCR